MVYPNIKILFGIRKKEPLLVSWYVKYIMNGGVKLFSEYINEKSIQLQLDYESFINKLYEIYGNDNVYIYRFKDLPKNPRKFVKGICDFINIEMPDFKETKKNVGYGKNRIILSILLNKLFKNQNNPAGKIKIQNMGLLPHRFFFQSKVFSYQKIKKPTI